MMNQSKPNLELAALSENINKNYARFDRLLLSIKASDLSYIHTKLHSDWENYEQQGILTIAFIGQYSAGKSTIISALTGRRDIFIDSNIATDRTASYDWNGIKLIDTPGLFTEHQSHDEITYDAINKADLLVFCVTHALFDVVTAKNFKELAYEKNYCWKMMLVVNKMSSEATEDEEQKIANYRLSLSDAIKPHNLEDFPVCFIDAKDYYDGIDTEDNFLIELSRFNTFISELNQFIRRRATAAKLDTPVRIILSHLDEAQLALTRFSGEDAVYVEILNRLFRVVTKERENLRRRVKIASLELSAEIMKAGSALASTVGTAKFQEAHTKAELEVTKHFSEAIETFEKDICQAAQSVQSAVEAELQSELVKEFIARLDYDFEIHSEDVKTPFDATVLRTQLNYLKAIGKAVGIPWERFVLKPGIGAGKGFINAGEIAGGKLHQFVYEAGKLVGFKFKPWQAVNLAKDIGNAAKFIGPALAVAGVLIDAYCYQQENEHGRKIAEARREITSQFHVTSVEVEQLFGEQLREAEKQIYGPVEQEIMEARQQRNMNIETSNTELKEIAEIRTDLITILEQTQRVEET